MSVSEPSVCHRTPLPNLSRRARCALAAVAALLLFFGTLNVRSLIESRVAWALPADGPSAMASLTGAPAQAASRLDAQILALQQTLRDDGGNGRAATLLGDAYLQKARETADPSYYPKAQLLFQHALDLDGKNFEAMVGLGTLALARHQFADGLQWGERARAIDPYHAPALGVIADAQVELGRYDEAVRTIQAMVDLRPDLASYARVSYIRELLGDRAGALAAMNEAATAGAASAENVAWTQVQLGNLRFDGGDLAGADHAYAEALAALPDYPYGLAGQAKVAAARGDLATAADLYDRAVRTMPIPEFVIAYGDVLAAAGRTTDADRQYALVAAIQQIYAANGVDVDLELALFTADHGRPDELPAAVDRMRAVVARRPSVTAYDALGWALYRSGDLAGARDASRRALRLGTQNPLLLFHAGMIDAALGDQSAAIEHLGAALRLNPHFSVRVAPWAAATLDRLRVEEAVR
jgi:tetratricopeptide (TPR) repeat protein